VTRRLLLLAAALALPACGGGGSAGGGRSAYRAPYVGGAHPVGKTRCCGANGVRGGAGFWAGHGLAAPPSGSGAGFWAGRGVAAPPDEGARAAAVLRPPGRAGGRHRRRPPVRRPAPLRHLGRLPRTVEASSPAAAAHLGLRAPGPAVAIAAAIG
jgi:hypothetical protein